VNENAHPTTELRAEGSEWKLDATAVPANRLSGRYGLPPKVRQVRGRGNRSIAAVFEGADANEIRNLLAAPRLREALRAVLVRLEDYEATTGRKTIDEAIIREARAALASSSPGGAS